VVERPPVTSGFTTYVPKPVVLLPQGSSCTTESPTLSSACSLLPGIRDLVLRSAQPRSGIPGHAGSPGFQGGNTSKLVPGLDKNSLESSRSPGVSRV